MMGTTASQVRQDFNCFCGVGQQGNGYKVDVLLTEIGNQLVAVGIAADKAGDRRAQAAGADQHGRQQLAVAKQQFANLGKQDVYKRQPP